MPKKNNSQEYWAKRRQQDKIKVIKEGEKGIDNLKRLLKTNLDDVQKKIKLFYEKYGENPAEKMSYSEWQKYKAKLKRIAQKNPQDEFLQRLAKQNIPKYQIDRLRALELDLQMQLTEATQGQAKGIYNTLDDVARVSQSVLAKSMQASIGLKLNTIADRKLKQLLSSDWSSTNWSDRLWHDRAVVGKKVTEILQKGVTQGTSLQKMARELKQTTNQSFNNAFRLIRTETSHIDGQVTLEGYKQAGEELGLEYYEYDAFLDSRTSTLCRDLDKKRFKVSEAEVGINYPPMHPNCRSTTQLVLDEEYNEEENIKIDFSKDNTLPKFNKKQLKKINKILADNNIDNTEINKNKDVFFRYESILRNKDKHQDISDDEYSYFVKQALYNPVDINLGRKEGYLEFLGNISDKHHSSVVIDTKDENNVFAIAHVHKKRKKRNKK